MAAAPLVGCDTAYLEALTVPPHTKTAELDDAEKTLEISRGVALGFECTYRGAPCARASAKVKDTARARVMASYVDDLSPVVYDRNGNRRGKKDRAVFVILGVAPGETTLTVSYDDGESTDVAVTVVP